MAADVEHCNSTCKLCGAPALLLFRGCDCSNESCPEVPGVFAPGDSVSWLWGNDRHFGVVLEEGPPGTYEVHETLLGGLDRWILPAERLEKIDGG